MPDYYRRSGTMVDEPIALDDTSSWEWRDQWKYAEPLSREEKIANKKAARKAAKPRRIKRS